MLLCLHVIMWIRFSFLSTQAFATYKQKEIDIYEKKTEEKYDNNELCTLMSLMIHIQWYGCGYGYIYGNAIAIYTQFL